MFLKSITGKFAAFGWCCIICAGAVGTAGTISILRSEPIIYADIIYVTIYTTGLAALGIVTFRYVAKEKAIEKAAKERNKPRI